MTRFRCLGAGTFVLCVLLASCASSGSLPSSYRDDPAPVRLPTGMDDRSPQAYYTYGTSIIETRPGEAAQAFHWASTLDPTWAAPIFARRTALLMMEPGFFWRYRSGSRAVLRDPRTAQLDSMYFRALQLNPFLDRSLEGVALRYAIRDDYIRQVGANPGLMDEAALAHSIELYLNRAGPETRGWLAHADRRYGAAVTQYRQALRRLNEQDAVWVRVELARVLFHVGDYTSAREELERAIAALHDRDEDRLVYVYRSKAVLEHTLGLIHETMRDHDGARQRYSNALQEDLSYHQAHLRIADLARAQHDTATARAAYQLALQIAPGNPSVLMAAGGGLAAMGDTEEAEAALLALIAIAPSFALPHHVLATVLDDRGDARGAAERYGTFLEIASPGNAAFAHAEERYATLTAVLPDGGVQ